MDIKKAQWITPNWDLGDVCPVFRRSFSTEKPVKKAELEITALGVYEAELNGRQVGDFVLAPGWTSYEHRLQVQTYDVTGLLSQNNELRVTVGRGWFRSPMPGWENEKDRKERFDQPCGLIALLRIGYADGTEETVLTDEAWEAGESATRFSEIYDGETCDARVIPGSWQKVKALDWSKDILIPQEGEEIREMERIAAKEIIHTPAGETLVDFGQEVTGWVEFTVNAKAGDLVYFNHGEVLDKDGNFYNENYRSAKAEARYICKDGKQTWHPRFTFFGFRYIHLISWPNDPKPEDFTAVAVYSNMRRTGWLKSGDPLLNQFFSNVTWGQRGNFLDVPTDCPQRDERLGWTGDAEVFVKTASYFFDVEKFFKKWLHDMAAEQFPSGGIGSVIPNVLEKVPTGAAWGDAVTICPWQIYQTYGDKMVLSDQFDSMKKWVDYIGSVTKTPDLWISGVHFGDWLSLDAAEEGSCGGGTRPDFIGSAYYAYSTSLVVKAGKLLGKDMSEYETLYARIVAAFRQAFPTYLTQTEHVLAAHFRLSPDPQKTADALADMVVKAGVQLRTGFVGTPYLLHVLTDYGHGNLAWSLLLRREYPGWLYPVTKGATTVWERWNGIKEDGSFESAGMNSFNHYAYGAVADWVFEQAAGLRHGEDQAGFSELIYAPHPDQRAGWLQAKVITRHGPVSAYWQWERDGVRYELDTPVPALVRLPSGERKVAPGKYTFWEKHQ